MDPSFTFSDPAFPSLDAAHAKGMFAMFVTNKDTNKMQVEYKDVKKGANDLTYTATYTVQYLFAGRPVLNTIKTTLTISPTTNLLASQVDEFPFWAWSRQALGLPGLFLGWSGYLQNQVQTNAGAKLEKFLAKSQQSQS